MSWGPATVFIHQRLNLDGTAVTSANGHISSDVSSSDADNYSDDDGNASDCTDSSDDAAAAAAADVVNSSSTSKQQHSPGRSAEQAYTNAQVRSQVLSILYA
jgi:hypothetical protein